MSKQSDQAPEKPPAIRFISVRGESPLTFSERCCLGILTQSRLTSKHKVFRLTGLGKDTVTQAFRALVGYRLARRDDRGWVVVEPDEVTRPWFGFWKHDGQEKLAYTRVVLGATGLGLQGDVVYAFLRSLSAKGKNRAKSLRRLARQVTLAVSTVKALLDRLRQKGLISLDGLTWQILGPDYIRVDPLVPTRAEPEATKEKKPEKKPEKQKPEPACWRPPRDVVKERLLAAGMRETGMMPLGAREPGPCGCVPRGAAAWKRLSLLRSEMGPRERRIIDALDKTPFDAEFGIQEYTWWCPRCDSDRPDLRKDYDRQAKRLISVKTKYDLFTLAIP